MSKIFILSQRHCNLCVVLMNEFIPVCNYFAAIVNIIIISCFNSTRKILPKYLKSFLFAVDYKKDLYFISH